MEITVGNLIKKAKLVRCGGGEYPVLSMTMHDGLMFQNDRFKKQIASIDKSKVLSETHIFYAEKSITPTTPEIFLKGRCIYGNEF